MKSLAVRLCTETLQNVYCDLIDDEGYFNFECKHLSDKKLCVALGRGKAKKRHHQEGFTSKFIIWQPICSSGQNIEFVVTENS